MLAPHAVSLLYTFASMRHGRAWQTVAVMAVLRTNTSIMRRCLEVLSSQSKGLACAATHDDARLARVRTHLN